MPGVDQEIVKGKFLFYCMHQHTVLEILKGEGSFKFSSKSLRILRAPVPGQQCSQKSSVGHQNLWTTVSLTYKLSLYHQRSCALVNTSGNQHNVGWMNLFINIIIIIIYNNGNGKDNDMIWSFHKVGFHCIIRPLSHFSSFYFIMCLCISVHH